jgi:hypothetical protein
MEVLHMRSITFAVAMALIVVIGSSTLLRSRSFTALAVVAGMPPLQELHAMADVDTLPVQRIDDMSVETK